MVSSIVFFCLFLSYSPDTLYLVKVKSLSPVRLFVTPWAVVYQAPPPMEEEYWSGFPFPSPGDLPDPGKMMIMLTFSLFLLILDLNAIFFNKSTNEK